MAPWKHGKWRPPRHLGALRHAEVARFTREDIQRRRLTKGRYAMRTHHMAVCRSTLQTACLFSALICTAASAHHVPSCSGGPGGGADATGNQCSAAGHDADSTPLSEVIVRPSAAIAAPLHPLATAISSRSVAPAQRPQTAFTKMSAVRLPRQAMRAPAEPPVRTANSAALQATCSGGSDGGMDATGNQCNPVDTAGSGQLFRVNEN